MRSCWTTSTRLKKFQRRDYVFIICMNNPVGYPILVNQNRWPNFCNIAGTTLWPHSSYSFYFMTKHEKSKFILLDTGLPTKNETVKTTQTLKTWHFKAWFLDSAFNRVFWLFTKLLSTEIRLQGTLNGRKRSKQVPYNCLWSLILCGGNPVISK